MESRWRMNVIDFGLNLQRFNDSSRALTLAARITFEPDRAITDASTNPTGLPTVFQDFGGDQGWVYTNNFTPLPGHPHFPYGLSVESDH